MAGKKAPNVAGVNSPGRRSVYSMCGMCAVRCPIQVEVDDGRVIWLQGNANDKTMGTSLCAKGSAGLVLEYDDERPQHPLIRTGKRGEGKWKRATWDDALDYVAEKLKEVIGEFGAKGVALSDRGGPFADLTKSFMRAIGSPNYFNHDTTCGRNTHHAALSLFGLGRTGLGFDYGKAKHIVLYGRNIIEAFKVKEAKQFMQAVQNGAKVTYIDPRASLTATKATRFWQIRPNTEYALNLALIHLALFDNLYDKKFVKRWAIGLDEIALAVKETTPEWQEQYTGIPAAELRTFIKEIAAAAPSVIFHHGWMVARHRQSFYSARSALILNVLFGSIEAQGGLFISKKAGDAGRKGLNSLGAKIPAPKDKRVDGCGWKHKHWDGGPGLLQFLYEAIDSGKPYPMGAYLVYRHDPFTSMPDPEEQARILDKLKLLVAIDVNYSETSWYADVILPEATFLERANILGSAGGKKPAFNMRDQAIAPRFETRPAWWIFKELAAHLDAGEYFEFENIEEIWEHQLEGTGVSVTNLREKGSVSLAAKPIWWDRKDGLKFKTPSGKIELKSQRLEESGHPDLAPFEPPKDLEKDEFRLLFGRSAVHAHGQSMNNPLLNEISGENDLWLHPQRAGAIGISDGDTVEISNDGYSASIKARVTDWIHQDAAFMLHGYGRTIPLQTRAYQRGVADQRLQKGKLTDWDPVGGGLALCETTVRLKKV